MTTFGCLLHLYRIRAGLAQNALARTSGINVGTSNRLERDQRLPTGRGQIVALADALGLGPGDIDLLLVAAGLTQEARVKAARERWGRWRRQW